MRTAGNLLQDSPLTDGQIFIEPFALLNQGFAGIGTSNLGSNSPENSLIFSAPSSNGYVLASLRFLLRTGFAPNYQEQFGTAALKPGPSTVANTSDPLNLVGMPPTPRASLATLTGGPNGFVAKGIRIDYVDVAYNIATNPLSSFLIGISTNKYVDNVATVSTSLLNIANNGLQTAVRANNYVTRVIPTNATFITSPDTKVIIQLQLVNGAAAAVVEIFGLTVGVSFNFN